MTDRLFDPRPAPPTLDRLAAWPRLAPLAMARSLWLGRRNLLHLFHPEVQERGVHVARFAGQRLITLADAAMARHVLADRDGLYVKAPLYHATLGPVLGPTASLLIEGEASRARRRLLAPAFNARAMARAEAVIEAHVAKLLAVWRSVPHATVDLTRAIPRFALEVAMAAFFSAEPGAEADRLARAIEVLILDAGSPDFADLAGLPAWLPRRHRGKQRRLLRAIDAALYAIIDARLATPRAAAEPDLLDVLIGARDAETGARLSRKDLRDEVITLFLAGHETTALSLIWGLDRLAREPEAAGALAEAARAGPATAAADPALPLASRTYDEILRLYPPAFAIGRMATAPDRVGDLAIEAGDRIQIAIFMLHRSARYWERPGAFLPDRFEDRAPEAFMPFGAGPRLCIGLAFARLEAQHLLCRTLAGFRLEPLGPPPAPVGKITLRTAMPVQVRLHPVAAPPRSP